MYPCLGVAKNDYGCGILNFDQTHQAAIFIHPGYEIIDMFRVCDVDVIRAQAEEFTFPDKFLGCSYNRFRKGSRKHAGMNRAFRQVALASRMSG